jgi:single-strand DNA-binding protein
MNNVELIGRIAVDVKVGSGVASSLMAVHRIYKSRDGQDTDFIPLTFFGGQAENFSKMVSKGQQIGIDGRIKTSEYADQNGEKHYGWSVVVNHFYLLNSGEHTSHGSKSDNENTYKVDKQLDNLDQILDNVKADKQPAKQSAKQPEDQPEQQADESISPLPPLGNNRNNRSHVSGNDFSQKVVDNQPTVEQLEEEIAKLKNKAVPF